MSDKPRYTYAEIVRRLAEITCDIPGRHDFDVLEALASHDPHSVICRRCLRVWSVQPTDQSQP